MAFPRRLFTRVVIIVIIGVALLYGGVLFYTQVLNDAPDALSTADLDAALGATSTTAAATTVVDTTIASSTSAPVTSTTSGEPAAERTGVRWAVDEGSQVGYRVAEVLFGVNTEGVGRTDQVTGGVTIDEGMLTEATFEVDVASITSDDGRRDNQFRGRIMDATTYPTATFSLTEAIDLAASTDEGVEVSVEVPGDLTLRGVTQSVIASITARVENGRIGLLGSVPVLFTDFDIVDPSLPGITVEPDGLVEFVLVLSVEA
jgi:polyisoprenoid-binding protein YceI